MGRYKNHVDQNLAVINANAWLVSHRGCCDFYTNCSIRWKPNLPRYSEHRSNLACATLSLGNARAQISTASEGTDRAQQKMAHVLFVQFVAGEHNMSKYSWVGVNNFMDCSMLYFSILQIRWNRSFSTNSRQSDRNGQARRKTFLQPHYSWPDGPAYAWIQFEGYLLFDTAVAFGSRYLLFLCCMISVAFQWVTKFRTLKIFQHPSPHGRFLFWRSANTGDCHTWRTRFYQEQCTA